MSTGDDRTSIRSPLVFVPLVLGLALAAGTTVVLRSNQDRPDVSAAVGTGNATFILPQTGGSLRSVVPRRVRIGSAADARGMSLDSRYQELLGAEFDSLTPENAMKWRNLEPAPGINTWLSADQLVAYAKRHDQQVYGHTLVWHNDVPAWVSADWPAERIREVLRSHVMGVVSRYRDQVWAWDVVNEVLNEDGSLRDTLWLRKLGPDYIADAFRWAHDADPGARLFINEYGAEGRTRKADALLALVRGLRSAGVPVDGVGFQSHLEWDNVPKDIAENMRRFSRIGLSVAITELDVRIKLPVTKAKLDRQAAVYRQILADCLSVSGCVSLTVWGFTDARSWIPGYYQGYDEACLFDRNYRPKPAYREFLAELRSVPPPTSG